MGAAAQNITAGDIASGIIRFPKAAKRHFPSEKQKIHVTLESDSLGLRAWDPRIGPDRERSGVLRVGKAAMRGLELGTVVQVERNGDGVVLRPKQTAPRGGLPSANKSHRFTRMAETQSDAPTCPECGSEMKVRTARRGSNAGNKFWGCSVYPDCRGIVAFQQDADESDQNVSEPEPDIPAPECPNGHGPMQLRTARHGRNAGGQFWGCATYPACTETRAVESDAGQPVQADEPPLVPRKVAWVDGTLDRTGHICTYLNAGASLRALASGRQAVEGIAQCWLARPDTGRGPSPEASRVVGVMRKILQRGTAPPVDPDTERRLFETLGMASELESTGLPGDLARTWRKKLGKSAPAAAWCWQDPQFEVDQELAFDSDEEREFVDSWVPENLGATAGRWFVPQASLDGLAQSQGLSASGHRRVDFLVTAPWLEPFVVEIDGEQHESAEDVDAERDGVLAAAGLEVVRVSTQELARGDGPGLRVIKKRWGGPSDSFARRGRSAHLDSGAGAARRPRRAGSS